MSKNHEEAPKECLEALISRLTDIHASLLNEYRNETILRDTLRIAVRSLESCRLEY